VILPHADTHHGHDG